MQNPYHIVTAIRKQVEGAKTKSYSYYQQKKSMRYYTLYLDKIIFIQRQFRKYLVKKDHILQNSLSNCLDQYKQLREISSNLCQQKQQIHKQIQFEKQNIENIDSIVMQYRKQMEKKVQLSTQNLLNSAQKLAIKDARIKMLLYRQQQLIQNKNELKMEIRGLKLQVDCHEQKKNDWEQKIRYLREKIVMETTNKKQLLRSLELLSNSDEDA